MLAHKTSIVSSLVAIGLSTASLSFAQEPQQQVEVRAGSIQKTLDAQTLDRTLAQLRATEIFRFDEQGFHPNPDAINEATRRIAERASRYLDLAARTLG
jgi:hypothetical protein